MMSLPFTIRGVLTGFVDLEGVARLEDKELCLEFRMSSSLARFLRSSPREVRVAFEELEEAVFKQRLCVGMLRLRARRLHIFSQVPGSVGSELRLRCRREHWELARDLASHLSLRAVEQQLRTLAAENDQAANKLPIPTSSPKPTPPTPQTHQ